MTTLITGANGFVGTSLCLTLIEQQTHIRAASRKATALSESIQIKDINAKTDWQQALVDIDIVIHTAARVHIMHDDASDLLNSYREVNTAGTLHLATQAAKAGVKRFIFISSIKVNGETTQNNQAFHPDDDCQPTDPYALSKYEAEQGLFALAEETGMEVVIIRPPLVYGPDVKANFASMMSWLQKGIPLPFGRIHNTRSLIALDNLVDFIALCANREKSPLAANQIFLVSDNEDVSTTELLKKTAHALGKKPILLPIPVSLMAFSASCLGKNNLAERLFASLQIDSRKTHTLLDWQPITTMDSQLQKTAIEFLKK